MPSILGILLAIIISLLIFLLMKYILYTYTGWNKIKMINNQNFLISDSNKISKIVFKEMILTITPNSHNGQNPIVLDVTSILNGMTAAYKNNDNINYTFKLDDPGLNVYSFLIKGFNDPKTIKTAPLSLNWENSDVELSGFYKLLD